MGRERQVNGATLVTAYAVVPDRDTELTDTAGARIPVAVPATVADLCHPATITSVHPEFTDSVAGGNALSWTDTFFEDDDDVVAVFDFDYAEMESFYSKMGWCIFGSTFFCSGIFWTGVALGVPCFLNSNVSWNARSQHLAVTRDGVVFVHAKHPSCWGLPCTDVAKRVVKVPFAAITGCKLIEASGTACLCIDNTLHNVVVETEGRIDVLKLEGLKDPEGFRQLVLKMKRMIGGSSMTASAATTRTLAEVMNRAGEQNSTPSPEVTTLLREIRDELRQHNDVLRNLSVPVEASPVPSAPIGEARDVV